MKPADGISYCEGGGPVPEEKILDPIGFFEKIGLCVATIEFYPQIKASRRYATAVRSFEYCHGDRWIIVQAYDTEEESKRGHEQWVEKMRSDPPPELTDCRIYFPFSGTYKREPIALKEGPEIKV